MADAFGLQKGGKAVNVAIRFAPRQARWIRERRWHRSARVQEGLDGSLVLSLQGGGDERDRALGAPVRPRGRSARAACRSARAVAEQLRSALSAYERRRAPRRKR